MPLRVDAAIRAALGGEVPPVATLPASRCGSLAEVLVLVLLVGQCDWRASKYPLMQGQIFQIWGVIEPVVYDGVNDLKGLRPHRSFGPTLGPLFVRSPVPRKMDASACLVR